MPIDISKIKKDDMISMLKKANIAIPSTKLTKQQLYDLAPEVFEEVKKPVEKKVPEKKDAPRAIAAANFKRLIVVVEDSDKEDTFLCRGHNLACENFAFEKSSGTSNEESFRNVFLPILRTNSGWLAKDSGLSRITVPILKVILDELRKEGHSRECIVDSAFFLSYLIDRFGCWRQLQISAALSGDEKDSTWNVILAARKLKEFALQFNVIDTDPTWDDSYAKAHLEIDQRDPSYNKAAADEAVKAYKDMAKKNFDRLKSEKREKNFVYDKETNTLFSEIFMNPSGRSTTLKGVRSFNQKPYSSRVVNAFTFVYQRDRPMPPIEYKSIRPEQLTTESELNAWLDKYSALCVKYHLTRDGRTIRNPSKEDIEKDTAKNIRDSATPKQLEERRGDKPGFFSGWLLC